MLLLIIINHLRSLKILSERIVNLGVENKN